MRRSSRRSQWACVRPSLVRFNCQRLSIWVDPEAGDYPLDSYLPVVDNYVLAMNLERVMNGGLGTLVDVCARTIISLVNDYVFPLRVLGLQRPYILQPSPVNVVHAHTGKMEHWSLRSETTFIQVNDGEFCPMYGVVRHGSRFHWSRSGRCIPESILKKSGVGSAAEGRLSQYRSRATWSLSGDGGWR